MSVQLRFDGKKGNVVTYANCGCEHLFNVLFGPRWCGVVWHTIATGRLRTTQSLSLGDTFEYRHNILRTPVSISSGKKEAAMMFCKCGTTLPTISSLPYPTLPYPTLSYHAMYSARARLSRPGGSEPPILLAGK